MLFALLMCLLSAWKTYSGPAIAGVLGFSYFEMLAFNFIPAMVVALKFWYAGSFFFSEKKTQAKKSSKLEKLESYWTEYGDTIAGILAPILIGIPSYVIIARKLRNSFKKTFLSLGVFTLMWSSVFYYGTLVFNLDKHLNIESYIDKVEEIQENHQKKTQGKEK